MFMGYNGYIVDNNSNTLLTSENIERLRGIPIFFIHGNENAVYDPISTMKDLDLLTETFGNQKSLYDRQLFLDKGHLDCWMGHESHNDVYFQVEQHARATILERGLTGRS